MKATVDDDDAAKKWQKEGKERKKKKKEKRKKKNWITRKTDDTYLFARDAYLCRHCRHNSERAEREGNLE